MSDINHRPSRPPPNRRRDKAQLSCETCRRRKLKCDRQRPCGGCLRRGITDSCNYVTSTASSPIDELSTALQQTSSLQGRLSELESLVVKFMENQSLPTPSSASPMTELQGAMESMESSDEPVSTADAGTLNSGQHGGGTSYVQSAHWEVVLTKIRGMKQDIVTGSKVSSGSSLFYGPSHHASRDEILAALPPRSEVDRLLALHFESYFVTLFLIHGPTFVKEYEAFWRDPVTSPMAWTGLMFSMLSVATQLQISAIDLTDVQADLLNAQYIATRDFFGEKAVECLVLAKYTTGGPHVLEALILLLTRDFVLSKNNMTDGWLSVSTIYHIAVRMGYHRDPSHFHGISPFEGEMRRRIWTTILSLDIALSLEQGLPRSATDTHIDTRLPQNLRDSDFSEETTEMPSPRSETEWTPVLPLIARGRLISVLGSICDINADINTPSNDKIAQVDAMLQQAHDHGIPPALRWRSTPHSITDSPNLVIQRVSCETTYQKSRLLLHRRALANRSGRQPHARDREAVRICLDSALNILILQQTLHQESQPFCRLSRLKWKVTHIFNQDALLATSVLCLYLQDIDKFQLPGPAGQPAYLPKAEEIRQRLRILHDIWSQMGTASGEAGKVAKALSIVLGYAEEESAGAGSEDILHDFMADYDAMTTTGLDGAASDQSFPCGLYSPLAFFDNLLESGQF